MNSENENKIGVSPAEDEIVSADVANEGEASVIAEREVAEKTGSEEEAPPPPRKRRRRPPMPCPKTKRIRKKPIFPPEKKKIRRPAGVLSRRLGRAAPRKCRRRFRTPTCGGS